MSLNDRMAVVTGAGSGIGRGVALALAARGAAVAAVDLDVASAQETAGLIASAGGHAEPFQCDTSKGIEIDRAVTVAIRALGPLEIMVNNAGILDGYFNVDEMDETLWRRVIDIDLTGVFLGSKRALAEMLPRGHGRRRGVRRGQARRRRAHPPDGGGVLLARRDDQCRVPRAHLDQPAPALAGDPRAGRPRQERAGHRGERGAGPCGG